MQRARLFVAPSDHGSACHIYVLLVKSFSSTEETHIQGVSISRHDEFNTIQTESKDIRGDNGDCNELSSFDAAPESFQVFESSRDKYQ